MRNVPFAKIAFVLSALCFAWLYGFATSARRWFPNDVLVDAWHQGQELFLSTTSHDYSNVHDRVYQRVGVRAPRPEEIQDGLTLVASAWRDAGRLVPGLRLIDRSGTVLHAWQVDPTVAFPEMTTSMVAGTPREKLAIHGSHLFENGDVLVNLEYAGVVRLDACGRVLWRLPAGNHHSIHRDDDGTFWIPAIRPEPRSGSGEHPEGFPGLSGPVFQDLIMRVAEDGTVLDSIHLLDLIYENDLEWHLAEEGRLGDEDPTHLNDVEPLPDSLADEYPLFEAGDLVVSLRHLQLVFVFDPASRRVRWTAPQELIVQHDPDFIGEGWIGVFDNRRDGSERGTVLGGSRIVAFQPHTDSVRVLFPTPRSERFYTPHRGRWQLLDNGNLLLVEEAAGRIVEVAPDGETVWEWIVEPFTESTIPAVTEGHRVDLSRDRVASWPCSP